MNLLTICKVCKGPILAGQPTAPWQHRDDRFPSTRRQVVEFVHTSCLVRAPAEPEEPDAA